MKCKSLCGGQSVIPNGWTSYFSAYYSHFIPCQFHIFHSLASLILYEYVMCCYFSLHVEFCSFIAIICCWFSSNMWIICFCLFQVLKWVSLTVVILIVTSHFITSFTLLRSVTSVIGIVTQFCVFHPECYFPSPVLR